MKKLTEKQEDFCAAYVETGVSAEAYRRAYGKKDWKQNVLHRQAHRVLHLPHVQARIEELKKMNAVRNNITIDTLLAELEEARQVALHAETPQASAAISATMGKAKLCGLDKQIIEQTIVVHSGLDSFYSETSMTDDCENDDE